MSLSCLVRWKRRGIKLKLSVPSAPMVWLTSHKFRPGLQTRRRPSYTSVQAVHINGEKIRSSLSLLKSSRDKETTWHMGRVVTNACVVHAHVHKQTERGNTESRIEDEDFDGIAINRRPFLLQEQNGFAFKEQWPLLLAIVQ